MQLLTINQAAEISGKSIQTIRRMIKKKKLQIKRKKTPQGFNYLIFEDSLLGLLKEPVQAPIQTPTQTASTTQMASREHRSINDQDNELFKAQIDGLNVTIQKLVEQNAKDKENFFGLVRTFQDRIVFLENHIKLLEAPKPWWKIW